MAAWESIMTALYHITEQTVLAIVLPPWPGKAAGNAKGGKSVCSDSLDLNANSKVSLWIWNFMAVSRCRAAGETRRCT